MTSPGFIADLPSRAAIGIGGADWRGFLQGLITQDVETLEAGEARFAALLTPQGRLLFDLFVVGEADGCLIDCQAEGRRALIQRLKMYRLRAKVDIEERSESVAALWDRPSAPPGWVADPRLPELGFRGWGATPPTGAARAAEADYERCRIALGIPGAADFGSDATYPIEANFDLLGGIDFHKGCFVGQETTSRMKRRGGIKRRMAPIAFDGAPPAPGEELLAGGLRAGEALSGVEGMAMAALRLDRIEGEPRTFGDGRPWRPAPPTWFKARLGADSGA